MKRLVRLFVFVLPWSAFSQIMVAPASIESRFEQAAMACVCIVDFGAKRSDLRASNAIPSSGSMVVLRAYKGLRTGQALDVNESTSISLAVGVRYLLMLQTQPDETKPLIVDAVPVPANFVSAGSSDDHASLENDIDSYLTLTGADIQAGIQLLFLYSSLSAASQNILEDLAHSPDDGIALLSMSILLEKNINSSQIFPKYLSRLASTRSERYPEMGEVDFVFTQNATTSEIGTFEELARSENREIRNASLRALRKLADPATTPFLVSELDAADSGDQYLALITLAEIYHKTGDYGPGLGAFEENREKYIRLWQAWYRNTNR